MKANVIVNAHTNEEAHYHENQLRRYGYKVIANCYWTMLFEKNGWVVQLNREF
jgi:hypothetical protein